MIIKEILDMLIAAMNVVKHVPKLAPIIIPKHVFLFIYFVVKREIAIAVIPDDDWIIAEPIAPTKKLFNFVLVWDCIMFFILLENWFFKSFLIWSKEKRKMDNPLKINIKLLLKKDSISMLKYMKKNLKYSR